MADYVPDLRTRKSDMWKRMFPEWKRLEVDRTVLKATL